MPGAALSGSRRERPRAVSPTYRAHQVRRGGVGVAVSGLLTATSPPGRGWCGGFGSGDCDKSAGAGLVRRDEDVRPGSKKLRAWRRRFDTAFEVAGAPPLDWATAGVGDDPPDEPRGARRVCRPTIKGNDHSCPSTTRLPT